MAFMFETRFPQRVTAFAAQSSSLQKEYGAYGHHLKKHFNPKQR
jgi:homogentisate 1,2-dioxygenase